MKPLLLIGGGGHCRSCIDIIEIGNVYRIEGLVLPSTEVEPVLGYPAVGTDDELPLLINDTKAALIAIGQIKTAEPRVRLFKLLKFLGAELPIIISPLAYCSRHATIGEGTIIMHGAIVNAGARIGRNCIVNSKALIEHDAVIGDHCHISTSATVNGGAEIGESTFVGSGSVVRQGTNIDRNSFITSVQTLRGRSLNN